jgi:hypothetical protein
VPKFCKYCGYKMKDLPKSATNLQQSRISNSSLHGESLYNQSESTEDLHAGDLHSDSPPLGESLDEPPSYSEPRMVSPGKESEFPSIPNDVIDVLAGRLEVGLIKEEMNEVLEEIGKIEQRLDIGILDASEAKEKISENKNRLDEMKERKNNISEEALPYEEYKKSVLEMKDKLLKLEEMKKEGKISRESVYGKLFKEYNTEYLRAQELFEEETRRFVQWQWQLEEDVKNYHDHAELAMTRAQLGEISEEEALKEKNQYETDAKRRDLAKQTIQTLLGS